MVAIMRIDLGVALDTTIGISTGIGHNTGPSAVDIADAIGISWHLFLPRPSPL